MIRYLARLIVQFLTAHAVIVTPFDRYIGAAALKAFVLVAAALTALFSLLEFVDQLSFIGQGRYGLTDALAYVLLTAPFRLLQVTPVSMLLGCLLALGEFARNYELIALQSLGISEIRIIGAVLKLAVPIIAALFIMAEFVIPPSEQLAQAQRGAALSSGGDLRSDTSFWAQDDHQYLNVQRFESRTAARNIDIYAFASEGNLTSFIHAERADIRPDSTWHLIDVVRKRVDNSIFETEHLPTLDWSSFVSAEETRFLTLPPETIPPIALYRYVHDLGQRHQQAIRYEQELWRRASIPLSIVAMILIAAPFVFGLPRGQSTGRQIAIGAVFGIVFSLSQQIVGHLNVLLYLNPAVAAMAPSLSLIVLASYLSRRALR